MFLFYSLFATAQIQKPGKVNTTGKENIDPAKLKPLKQDLQNISFSAVIAQRRELYDSDQDGWLIKRFELMQWNDGNGFDLTSGAFKAPAKGLYCFVLNITPGNYGCSNSSLNLPLTVYKNNGQKIEGFFVPVMSGGINQGTSHSFTLLVSLAANEKIYLQHQALACTGGQRPMIQRLSFSGYKIY